MFKIEINVLREKEAKSLTEKYFKAKLNLKHKAAKTYLYANIIRKKGT